jgi:UDP-N-acetylmuramoyl-tripeptide--D-alanyl-D-alanine ligase
MSGAAAWQQGWSSMVWTGQEIVTATAAAGDAAEVAGMRVESVCTDSRRAAPGTLFVALRGERHDGHDFAAEALRTGATAALLERVPEGVARRQALIVCDTLRALGDLAAYTRARWGGPVAAITGSNGKTTTKEMLAAICAVASGFKGPRVRGSKQEGSKGSRVQGSKRHDAGLRGGGGGSLGPLDPWTLGPSVLKTHANENNLVGLPLTLLRLTGDEAVAVLEMGMNVPGEIARMTEIAAPDVGLITNIGPAHLEGLGSIAGVAAAKGELITGMRPDATIAVNMDDEWVERVSSGYPGRRVEFGHGRAVSASALDDRGFDGVAFTLHVDGRSERVALRMPGRHNVQNALGAAAAAHALGIALDAIAAGLAAAEPPKMRMQVVRLANGVTVVNDAYNANPASTAAALDAIARTTGRAIAVLGEMRELGAESAALHREIGAHAAACGVRWLVAVGPQAEHIAAGARDAAPSLEVTVCNDAAAAAALLIAHWHPGDAILIKGSRGPDTEEGVRRYGARMAEVAERLAAAGGAL